MITYIARYAHSDEDTVGNLELNASTDAEAIAELKDFVTSGYRNGTWANVELSTGEAFGCRNRHGTAICQTV